MPLLLLLGGGLLLLLSSRSTPPASPRPSAGGGGPAIDTQGFVVFNRFTPADVAALLPGTVVQLQDAAGRVWTVTMSILAQSGQPLGSEWFHGTVTAVSPQPPAPVNASMQFTAGEVAAVSTGVSNGVPVGWRIAP